MFTGERTLGQASPDYSLPGCEVAVRRLINRSLSLFGAKIVRLNSPLAGEQFLHGIYRRLGINLVLDVGANTGQTGVSLRSHGYGGRIVSFEPQTKVFEELVAVANGDPRWACRQEGLGAAEGQLEMEVSGFSPSSSVLHMRSKHVDLWPASRPVGRLMVPIRTLDGIAAELNLAGHNILLKIDVQGYEAAVLTGAKQALPRCSAALVELLFSQLYEGQSQYYEVMAMLEAAGLKFVGLFGEVTDPTTGFLIYADGLFVKGVG